MANESSKDGESVQANGLPTRVLRIEGERTAGLYAASIRVSRIDIRLRELSLSTASEQRRQFRLGNEGYAKAVAQFEDAITQIEKDIANPNRSSNANQRNNRQQGQLSKAPARKAPAANQQSSQPEIVPVKDGVVQRITAAVQALTKPQQQQQHPQKNKDKQRQANGSAAQQGAQKSKPIQQPKAQQQSAPKPATNSGQQQPQQQPGNSNPAAGVQHKKPQGERQAQATPALS
jgi:hypothetical protein